MLPRARKLGYFRLLSSGDDKDNALCYMRGVEKFGLGGEPESAMVGMSIEEAMSLFARGRGDEIYGTILDRFKAYSQGKDFVLVSGERNHS